MTKKVVISSKMVGKTVWFQINSVTFDSFTL